MANGRRNTKERKTETLFMMKARKTRQFYETSGLQIFSCEMNKLSRDILFGFDFLCIFFSDFCEKQIS